MSGYLPVGELALEHSDVVYVAGRGVQHVFPSEAQRGTYYLIEDGTRAVSLSQPDLLAVRVANPSDYSIMDLTPLLSVEDTNSLLIVGQENYLETFQERQELAFYYLYFKSQLDQMSQYLNFHTFVRVYGYNPGTPLPESTYVKAVRKYWSHSE